MKANMMSNHQIKKILLGLFIISVFSMIGFSDDLMTYSSDSAWEAPNQDHFDTINEDYNAIVCSCDSMEDDNQIYDMISENSDKLVDAYNEEQETVEYRCYKYRSKGQVAKKFFGLTSDSTNNSHSNYSYHAHLIKMEMIDYEK